MTTSTGRQIGYARVSSRPGQSAKDQHVGNQVARLTAAGCDRVFSEHVTGTKSSRPQWDACQRFLRPGDTLLVTKLDRIGRSLVNVVEVVCGLQARGVGIRCLDQGDIDTTTANGRLVFQIMCALAEWEASLAKERTREGLDAAKVRYGGTLPKRGKSVSDEQIETARRLATEHPEWSSARIATSVGMSRPTLYRHVDIASLRKRA